MGQANNINFQDPQWLDKREYPFQGHYYETPVGKMHYLDEGTGDPIVMVHGNPVWSFIYRNLVKELSADYRCIAPDMIGFGLSDKPTAFDYLPDHQAMLFENLMNHLKLDKITLVVNDWGGPIGLSYALKHPDKIKQLIILNTWMWSVADDPYYQKFSGFMGGPIGRFLIKNFNFFAKTMVKKIFGNKSRLTPEIHKQLYMHLPTAADRKGCYVLPKQIIGSSTWLDDLWQSRYKINRLPATFIWGMKDIAFREKELKEWTENWHNYTIIKLEDAGHFPQEEYPNVVADAIRSKMNTL